MTEKMNDYSSRDRTAHQAHEHLVESTDLYPNVFDAAGEYDAKVDPSANSSLATHLLNAIAIGVNMFVFNAVGPEDDYADYEMHTTNQGEKDADENRFLVQQGITRNVEAAYEDMSEATENALASVALFGEYSGVGSAVARGCGCVGVQL